MPSKAYTFDVAHSRQDTGTVCDLPPKVVLREGRSAHKRDKRRKMDRRLPDTILEHLSWNVNGFFTEDL